MKCNWPLCINEARNKFCSRSCSVKFHVNKRRHKLKELAVEYKGGKCEICGYHRSNKALTFHHPDATKKEYGISSSGHTRSWEALKKEIDKCHLLCENCHREVHAGLHPKYLHS